MNGGLLDDLIRSLEPIHATLDRFKQGGPWAAEEIKKFYRQLLEVDLDRCEDFQDRINDLEGELAEATREISRLEDDLREALRPADPIEDVGCGGTAQFLEGFMATGSVANGHDDGPGRDPEDGTKG
jgi:hypothetical protein